MTDFEKFVNELNVMINSGDDDKKVESKNEVVVKNVSSVEVKRKLKLLFISTHVNQGNGYSKVAYQMLLELAKYEWLEVTHFGTQKMSTGPGGDLNRKYPDNIKVIDGSALEKDKQLGFSFVELAAAVIPSEKPDIVFIYNDLSIISAYIEEIRKAVTQGKFDLGISHDGDADRALAVDQAGNLIDGDHILAILALDLKSHDRLKHNTVVSTVMANLGFTKAMAEAKINTVPTAVGDRYVLEEMEKHDYQLGGEQSGHIIFRKFSTTGDGLLTALQLMQTMARQGKSLSELASAITKYPQVLINVPNVSKAKIDNPQLQDAIKSAESTLNDKGRVLLRASGTEPLIRVMVEAETDQLAQVTAEKLAEVVKTSCSL
jgi:phosphomannomutase